MGFFGKIECTVFYIKMYHCCGNKNRKWILFYQTWEMGNSNSFNKKKKPKNRITCILQYIHLNIFLILHFMCYYKIYLCHWQKKKKNNNWYFPRNNFLITFKDHKCRIVKSCNVGRWSFIWRFAWYGANLIIML